MHLPRHRLTALALLAAALSGCAAEPLSQAWQLDRLRVLAVRPEPAEPRPGEEVRFTPLLYVPGDVGLAGVLWLACLPDEATDDYGCTVDEELLADLEGVDPSSLTPAELAGLAARLEEAGVIGFQPWVAPAWTAPEDALDGLDDVAALEGVSAIVQLVALPADPGADDPEIAFKRVPVSLAETPNHNPDLVGFLVDGEEVAPGALVEVGAGEAVEIEPVLADDAVEDYVFVPADGVREERTEEPYVTWYAEGGAFDQPWSLWPYTSVEWTAPARDWEGLLVAVVRDRRGGMGWASLHLRAVEDR